MTDNKYIEELWIGIKADYASLQTGLKQAQNEIRSFSGHIGQSSDQLMKMGRTISIVSGATLAFFGLLNMVYAKFEQSMANTFSVLGASKREMDELTAYARQMGETTVFSASQAADAMYYLASAGYNASQTIGALKGTLDLAAATQFDLAETTRIVVSALNSYNFEAAQATRVSNVFSAVIGASQANMEKIGYSFSYVAPIAAGLGLKFEELTASLGLLYNAGIQASTAGTALRQIFAKLQAPTEGAIKSLAKLGLTADDVNPQLKSITEIIRAFEQAGAGAIDKGDELAEIFDIRSVAPFQVLVRAGADALEVMETKITGTRKASEMANTQVNTFSGSVKLMKSALEETAIQIGESLQPILRGLVQILTDATKIFNSIPTPIKAVAVSAIALAAGLGLIVGPVLLLVAKLPLLAAGFTVMGTSMTVALGAVGLVTAALTALVFMVGNSISKQYEQGKALTEGIAKLKEQNEAMVLQKEKMLGVVNSYVQLADKQGKSTKEVEAQKSAFDKIKQLYPSLISSTDDYTTAVGKIKKIAAETSIELEELYKKKVKLRELELRIDVNKAKDDLRELEKEIKDASTTSMFIPQINTQQQLTDIIKISKTAEGVLESAGEKGAGKIEKMVDLTKVLSGTFDMIGETINNKGVFSLDKMAQKLETIILETEGVNRVTEDSENLISSITDLDVKRNELRTSMKEKESKMNQEISAEMKQNLVWEKQADERKLWHLDKSITALESMSGIYTQIIEVGANHLGLQTQITEKELELNQLKKEGLKLDKEIVVPKGDGGAAELTDAEKNRIEELEREIFALKRQSLESQLAIYEKYRDDSIEADMRYLDAKFELEKMDLEFGFSQKEKQLVKLKATNDTMLALKKLQVEKELEQDEKYIKDKEKVDEKWFKKSVLMKENEFKYSLRFDNESLLNWRKVLESKKIALEDAGKKYTDEWADIVDRINATTTMIKTPLLNKMDFEIEMFRQGKDGYDGEALDEYQAYLDGQLEKTQMWSDEYVNILLEQERIKDEIRDRELDKNRFLFFSIRDMALVAQAGISAGFDHMWSKYVIGAREAKNEMDAIWLAIRNAVLKMIGDIIQAEITKMFLKLLAKIVGTVAGGPLGGAAASVATAAIPTAATGAQVVKSGRMVVHKDEMVIPARIVRANDDKYQTAMDKGGGSERKGIGNMNLNVVLNNPSVDDKKYWENVIEKHVEPAFVKLKKRYEN